MPMDPHTADLSGLSRDRPLAAVPLPSIRWRTRVALPATVVVLTGVIVLVAAWDVIVPAVDVETVPVIYKNDVQATAAGEVIVQAPGWVEADPFPIAVSALTDGVVSEVRVLEGQRVEADQIVARLVDAEARIALQRAEADLSRQRAAVVVARATLEEARQNWDHPIELTRRVQAAEAMLAHKQAELARWPSELRREMARSTYLEAEYTRLKPLHERGQANDIELVNAEQTHLAQQAEVDRVRLTEDVLDAQVRMLEADVRAARETLELRIEDRTRLAEAEAVVQQAEAAAMTAQAERDSAALTFERMTVRSPAHGVVMVRLVEPGSKLMLSMDNPRSAQVVRLYDPQRLQVRVDVPLADAARIGVGQPAEVIVDVLPDRTFKGIVTRIVHEADVQKNTLQVKVAIKDPVSDIKPEMLARARFLGGVQDAAVMADGRGVVFVPRAGVVERDGQTFVWLADQVAAVARFRAITIERGVVLEDAVGVSAGLQTGDLVIIGGADQLVDGQRIRIHAAGRGE